jgi:FdhE protein
MNDISRARLARLGHQRPDWRPWLEVLSTAVEEATDPAWELSVPSAPRRTHAKPLLADAEIPVDAARARNWLLTLFKAAAAAGVGIASSGELCLENRDALAIMAAAIQEDGSRLAALAMRHRWLAEPFHAVAVLGAFPLLQAVGRRWAPAIPPTWRRGCCPMCGAWPALAEARGLDRRRWLRCARCGSEWEMDHVRCVFCDNADPTRLGLMAEAGDERRHVETCALCRGYLKALSTSRAGPAAEVILDDLVSVDLDVAAVRRGYARPPGPGFLLGLRLVERIGLARRLLARRA